MRRTNLRGHALRREGRPFERSDEGNGWVTSQWGWDGYGVCECGQTSQWLSSNNARKRWHAQHKDEVRPPDA